MVDENRSVICLTITAFLPWLIGLNASGDYGVWWVFSLYAKWRIGEGVGLMLVGLVRPHQRKPIAGAGVGVILGFTLQGNQSSVYAKGEHAGRAQTPM